MLVNQKLGTPIDIWAVRLQKIIREAERITSVAVKHA